MAWHGMAKEHQQKLLTRDKNKQGTNMDQGRQGLFKHRGQTDRGTLLRVIKDSTNERWEHDG